MAKSKCADAKGIQTACPAVRVKTACHKTTRDFPKHHKQFLKRSETLCWQTCQLNRTESPNRDSSNQDGTLIFRNNEIRRFNGAVWNRALALAHVAFAGRDLEVRE